MRRFTTGITCALTLLALAGVGGWGCESDNKKDDFDDRDIYRRDRAEETDRDRDVPRDRADDRVISRDPDRRGGTGSGRRRGIDEIPAEAVAVEAGEGRSGITYTAEREGTVYVYDVDDDRVIHVGRMMAKERFRLLPEDGEATLDGRPVFRSDLNPRHRFRLYFDRRG